MKKTVFTLFFMIFTFIFSKDNQIIIGLDDTYAPMGFKNEKNELVGFDIDLAREVGKRIGKEVIFQNCDWAGILFQLKTKKIDAIWNGLTITPEREKVIAFSDPYLSGKQVIVTKDKNIKSEKDLENKIVAVQMGSSSYFSVTKSNLLKKENLKKYPTNVEALLDLENGRVDAVVTDFIVAKYYSKNFYLLETSFPSENIGVGLRKDDVELKNSINKALSDMKSDGSFEKIYNKWF